MAREPEPRPDRPGSPVRPEAAAIFETPFGRDDDRGTIAGTRAIEEIEDIDLSAVPLSEITGAPEPGTPTETVDGLDETEEAVRQMAEDVETGGDDML